MTKAAAPPGNGNFNLFNVKAANYNYFEGVTIRNTEIGIWAGTQFIAGSKGLIGGGQPTSALEARRFQTLADYTAATHQDVHSVGVDYDVFVNVPRLDGKDLTKVQMVYKAEDVDFRLKPGSAAVDRGVVLPNVTDGFAGQAPDLGALEFGQALPHYGPRPP